MKPSAFALLAALILGLPGVARPGPGDDSKKEIADVEKQILELKKKLDELRKGKLATITAVPDSAIAKMNWRCIGPANMGGRVTALAVVESDPATYYVATASGGLLKTVNNGTTFTFAFDNQATVSIGDVAVAPSDPNVLYLGTGESNPRNSASYGDGVYKSTDAGKTWKNVGLKQSFQIGKIVIHPKEPNVVYVAALGRLWGPNAERGVFKTADGGQTWAKVLHVDDKTGAIDLRMDPFDPNTLLAGLWERKRDEFDGLFTPADTWSGPDQYGPVVAHGPGGGLFKTADAGKTWKKLTGSSAAAGLPTVNTGRIGIDYSRKTKGLVYAIIDTESIGKGRPALRVYLGIAGDGDKGGAKITAVVDDGPAAKAGLMADDLITAIDGKAVAGYDDLLDLMTTKKPGDAVAFTVVRAKKKGKETLTIEMKLTARPAAEPKAKGGPQSLSPGGIVMSITGLDDPVKVSEVPKGSAAEKAGVRAGMIVVGVEGQAGERVARVPHRVARLAQNRQPAEGRREGERPLPAGRHEAVRRPAAAGAGGRSPAGRGAAGRHPEPPVSDEHHHRRAAGERAEQSGQGRLPDRRRVRLEGRRHHLGAGEQPEPAAVLLQQRSRRPDRRQHGLRPRRYDAVEEYRRRQEVRQRESEQRASRPSRAVDQPEGRPTHDPRLRRRLLRHLRPRSYLGPPEHAGARAVLPCRGGHAHAIPRVRWPSRQRQLGRPVAHPAAGSGPANEDWQFLNGGGRLRLPR